MPPTASVRPTSPLARLRSALVTSLYQDHRPELADLIASAELFLESSGLWVQPEAGFGTVSPAWLEPHLLTAALEAGLPLDWIRVLSTASGTSPGGEA
jgi:hypothetical protein